MSQVIIPGAFVDTCFSWTLGFQLLQQILLFYFPNINTSRPFSSSLIYANTISYLDYSNDPILNICGLRVSESTRSPYNIYLSILKFKTFLKSLNKIWQLRKNQVVTLCPWLPVLRPAFISSYPPLTLQYPIHEGSHKNTLAIKLAYSNLIYNF